jgi:indole-3-glycerol phosphate synthase
VSLPPEDFLALMARSSAARVVAARRATGELQLTARAGNDLARLRPRLDGRFDLIAELKRRSPAQGVLAGRADDLEERVLAYARGGAAIVSVLTEPDRFDGSLEHLARASQVLTPLGVPVMRKDFLVDEFQLLEACVAGASGVLLIVRMLEPAQLATLVSRAERLGLFVLLEAFDAQDVAAAAALAAQWRGPRESFLVGINSRDLRTLKVVPGRLGALAATLPAGYPRVAESGLASPEDAARLAGAGYTLALVGTALMSATDPAGLVRQMVDAGRAAAPQAAP